MTSPVATAAIPPGRPLMPAPKPAPDPRLDALSLLDEAAHRLRAASAWTLGIYYASTLPFVLALLYFWADMSRSADAQSRGAGLALGLAVLFAIMKSGQAVFAARLRAQLAGRPPPRWTVARLARVFVVQATWQPTGLFILPAAIVVFLPLGWVYAFYQNLTVCGNGDPEMGNPVTRAWRHTWSRPGQNHRALSVFWALEFFAWLALMVAMYTLPMLLKMFTGEDNIFTRSDFGVLLNSTFLAVSAAIIYVVFNPLAKTFYALRCFYDDARSTGEDLLAELNALPPVGHDTVTDLNRPLFGSSMPSRALTAVRATLLAVALFAALPAASAAVPSPPPEQRTVTPGEVDRSVRDVLARREFAWRNPRQASPADKKDAGPGAIERFFKDLHETIDRWTRIIRHWLGLDKESPEREPSETSTLPTFAEVGLKLLLYVLVTVCAALIVVLLYRGWRARQRADALAGRPEPAEGTALPDLTDESILADRLPEDEWLMLAHNLLAQGERRLALRALYLSTLAGLGGRGLLGIARHKSNRDYQRELRRRTRDRDALPEIFARLVALFECVWYGSHPASDALLADFESDCLGLRTEMSAPAEARKLAIGLVARVPA